MPENKPLPERPAPPPRGTVPRGVVSGVVGGNGEGGFLPTAHVEGPDDASMRATVAVEPGGDPATMAVERGGDRDTVAMAWDDDPLDVDVDVDAGSGGDTLVQPASSGVTPPGLRSVRRVGRYLIRERLGRGGMGTVFKAHDPSIGRDVAIKFLHIALCQDKGGRARFLREARAAGRLSHPNIVTVHDVGEIDGRPYMAMELLEGPPLSAEMADRTALPLREAVAIGIQLARTLNYAHAHGVVHRDIKPGNIMRAAGTQAIKVTDFGIAHMEATGAEQRTRVGAILGTPQYMSPEQAQGKQLDGRSDLFSAGIVLYEMLTGQRPFAGDGLVAVAVNIVRDKPLPIDTLRPELPPSLCRVVVRCLEKAPERRFQTGQELAEALERVQGELDEAVRRKAQARGLSLGVKWTAAMALVVAAVMVATTVWIAQRQHAAMVDQVVDAGAAMSRFLAAQNALAALAEDWIAVDVAVQEVMKTGDFHSVVVADRDGVVRAAGDAALIGQRYAPPAGAPLEPRANGVDVSRHGAAGATVLDFRAPITFQGKRVGSVALGLAEEPLARVQRLSNGLMALLVLVTLVAVALAMYFVVGRFARPMEVLGAAMAEIEQGRFEHRIGERRNDEFGRLYAAFDRMARSLHEHRVEALEAAGTDAVAAAARSAGPPRRMSDQRPDEKPDQRPTAAVAPALTPVPSEAEAGPFRAPG